MFLMIPFMVVANTIENVENLIAQKKGKEAIKIMKKLVKDDEDNAEYQLLLGKSYFSIINNQQVGQLKAISYFKKGKKSLLKAIELDDNNIEARIILAEPLYYIPGIVGGDKEKALEFVEEIKAIDYQKGMRLKISFMGEDDEESALVECEKYLQKYPDDVDILYEMGMIYQSMESYDDAFSTFEKAVEIDSTSLESLYQIGRTSIFSGERLDYGEQSLKEYIINKPIEGNPGLDSAHWRLGMIYELQGKIDLAKEEFEEAIRLNPDDRQYKKSLKKLKK